MWSEKEILKYLEDNLNKSRYEHTLGVVESAVELAKIYGADIEKVKMAALLHDCAKKLKTEEIIDIIKKENFELDTSIPCIPQIMHGRAGSCIAKNLMGIYDQEILDGITYHTTGRENMTLIEKIIFLADYIEPNRVYPGVDELRKISFIDLDKALIQAYSNTIQFLLRENQYIHEDTIKARNQLLKK